MGTLRIFTLQSPAKLRFVLQLDNGERVPVRFEPVVMFGRILPSIYTTERDEVAQKIMSRSDFGTFIFLKEEIVSEEQTVEEPKSEIEKLKSMLPDAENAVYEDTVTSVQSANHWLQMVHKTVFTAKNPTAVKMEAAKKYNTIFTNWV